MATADTITSYYGGIQYRNPPAAELSTYVALVDSGALTLDQVKAGIVGAPYTINFVDPVIREYQAAFGRVPDAAGLQYWSSHLADNSVSLVNLATLFVSSAEFQTKYGASTAVTDAFLNALYLNVLGRAPDPAGQAYWLSSGQSQAQILNFFAQSNEFVTISQPAVDAFLTLSATGVAPTTGTIFDLAPPVGVTTLVALTAGIDALTGTAGSETYIGAITGVAGTTTLNPGDTLNGAGGADSLKVIASVASADTLAGVTLTSIEGLSVQNASAGGFVNSNLINAGTVAKVTNTGSNGGTLTGFQNLNTGASVVASSNNGAAAAINTQYAMKVATDAVNVGFDGGISGSNLLASAGTATAATLTSTGGNNGGGAAGADFVSFTGGGATLKTLAVNATTNLTTNLSTADYVATGAALTVTGAATSVNLGANGVFKTVDASGLTAGGLTITTGATLTSLKGGTGKDVVTIGANPTAASTIDLGAGNDSLRGGVALPANAVVDGGAGTDTISAALVNVGSSANIKNFEALDVTGFNGPLDAALLTNSTISGLTFSGSTASATTAVIQNLANAATINVSGFLDQATVQAANLGNVTVTQTGANPTLKVIFDAAPGAIGATPAPGGFFDSIGTLKFTGETNLDIASGGNSFVVGNGINLIQDTSNVLKTVTITGDHAFTLGGVNTDTGVAAAAAATTIASSLTTIDGTAATGKLNITAGADTVPSVNNTITYTGLTINGGSANDTITILAKNGVVNAGAGNDAINVGVPNATALTGDVVTVNGGAGADTLTSGLTYNVVATAASAATNGNLTVFGDAASTDVVKFGTLANATGTFGAKANVAAAATFDQAVFAAEAGAVNTATWFQYAGNTYIEHSGASIATTADDIIVKLVGLVDLSGSTIVTGANGTITLA